MLFVGAAELISGITNAFASDAIARLPAPCWEGFATLQGPRTRLGVSSLARTCQTSERVYLQGQQSMRFPLNIDACSSKYSMAGDGAVHGVCGRAAGRGGRKPCWGLAGQGLCNLPRHCPGAPCRVAAHAVFFGRMLPRSKDIEKGVSSHLSGCINLAVISWALTHDDSRYVQCA